ncbi:O-acyltransferase like protein-like [Tachypleus tridentatus]|uniref:O-acyltransferase like protein-like n=1 Tax=Tachypleus tridentatus TaxID=6853 RepID=UPI003FD5A296
MLKVFLLLFIRALINFCSPVSADLYNHDYDDKALDGPWIMADVEAVKAWEIFRNSYSAKALNVTETIKPIMEDLLRTMNASETCHHSVMEVLTSFGRMETWASKMIDSNGRLPAGLLEGTLTSLGSYDQCMNIVSPTKESKVSTFQGQYCSVLLRLPLPARSAKYSSIVVGVKALSNFSKPERSVVEMCSSQREKKSHKNCWLLLWCYMKVFHDFAQNAQFFYSVPLRLGICVPSTCSRLEVQKAVTIASNWLRLRGNVQNCEVKTPVQVTARQAVSLFILSLVVIPVVVGTILDVYRKLLKPQERNELHTGFAVELLLCFSLYTNTLKLFSTKSSQHTMKAICGIRFITINWIILAHTLSDFDIGMMGGLFHTKEQVGDIDKQFVFQASLSVDTFFCITGFLTMYYVWVYTDGKAKNFVISKFIFLRYFRLTPPVVLVLCFVFLLPFFGSGPNWSNIVVPYVEGCYSTWWRNLLYINSLYKPGQCLSQTWYISCDFIFHGLSLIVFIPMFRKPKVGLLVILFLLMSSVLGSSLLTWYYQLPPTLFPAMMNRRKLGIMAEIRYYNPIHHLGSYCVGLYAGYAIAKKKFESISKFSVVFGWLFCSFLFLSVMYGMYSWNNGVEGSTVVAVTYASLHRPLWAASVAWVILMCVTGRGGMINSFLSWKPFLSLDRITYMLYLIHHVVITVYNGYMSYTIDSKPITVAYVHFGHISTSYLISVVCVLFVESPCLAVMKKYLASHKIRTSAAATHLDDREDGNEMVHVVKERI